MNIQKRRAVAYIAGRLIAGKRPETVYDDAASARYRICGDVSPDYIRMFGDDRNCYVRGDDFYGYDDETSSYFSGAVNKSSVTFFDFQSSNNFRYAI